MYTNTGVDGGGGEKYAVQSASPPLNYGVINFIDVDYLSSRCLPLFNILWYFFPLLLLVFCLISLKKVKSGKAVSVGGKKLCVFLRNLVFFMYEAICISTFLLIHKKWHKT